jgi:hypothetical protein
MRLFFFLMAAGIALCACTDVPDELVCTSNADCEQGYSCDPQGDCLKADPLQVVTTELSEAVVGSAYAETVQATGGLPPYRWTATFQAGGSDVAWLSIEAGTGRIASAGAVPEGASGTVAAAVTVRDSSNAGEGVTAGAGLSIAVKDCVTRVYSYRPQDSACWRGFRDCVDSVLSADWTPEAKSADPDHCGPDCQACPSEQADACRDGLCACGNNPACAAAEVCCTGLCADLQESAEHCGSCGIKCDPSTMVNAESVFCNAGSCDYAACSAGFRDCTGGKQDGCESTLVQNCSACGDDCTDTGVYLNTHDQTCSGQPAACAFACDTGTGDCDQNAANGCEQALDVPAHCGDCATGCTQNDSGHACVASHCGCETSSDCPTDRMCCNNLCIPHDSTHCADCTTPCSILLGGPHCVNAAGSWQCQCSSPDECRAGNSMSSATCSSTTHKCKCSDTEVCAGTLDDFCCSMGKANVCVDLFTDVGSCGLCGADCAAGESCQDGACTCGGDGDCPNDPNQANQCVNANCACPYYANISCPVGKWCCASEGCCDKVCADSTRNCCLGPKQWCPSGACCTSCSPDTGCN